MILISLKHYLNKTTYIFLQKDHVQLVLHLCVLRTQAQRAATPHCHILGTFIIYVVDTTIIRNKNKKWQGQDLHWNDRTRYTQLVEESTEQAARKINNPSVKAWLKLRGRNDDLSMFITNPIINNWIKASNRSIMVTLTEVSTIMW